MEPDATLAAGRVPRHGALPAFLLIAAVIVGLFGMHILGMSLPGVSMSSAESHTSHQAAVVDAGHAHTHPAAAAMATTDQAAARETMPAEPTVGGGAVACSASCDAPMPPHPAMVMCCELALATGANNVTNPGPPAAPVEPIMVVGHLRSVLLAPAEPVPLPPSLLVLSISRT